MPARGSAASSSRCQGVKRGVEEGRPQLDAHPAAGVGGVVDDVLDGQDHQLRETADDLPLDGDGAGLDPDLPMVRVVRARSE